ncbi:hypothetical protein ZWY2020_045069 [Hordeum vulgare]|nr:hypothetical protein ZWY2020_045069 [Hordeum vulgare]
MNDPDLSSLALGIDLTTLGLNLNSPDNLYKTFGSPFSNEPAKGDPEYTTPACYVSEQPPALQPMHFQKFQTLLLFYIFYSMPKDEAQICAANELIPEGTALYPGTVGIDLILLALPAVLGQSIDPMAQLMETPYIGAVELASVGIGVAIFNIISKIFNIPLPSIATSFVAEDISKNATKHSTSGKLELTSVSSALVLAAAIGTIEELALFLGSGLFLKLTGVLLVSPMYTSARLFLSLRALGAPANVIILAVQGIFRGFKDTNTPVLFIGLGNLSAVVLLPLLIYGFKLDALAVSAQALIASSYAVLDYKRVHKAAMFALQIGLVSGLALAVGLYISFGSIARLFTNDPQVLTVVSYCALFVCASQPVNALAFIFDGFHYGVSDFDYVAQATIVVGVISSLVLLYAPRVFGLAGVWAGLTTLMGLRMAADILRLLWKSGPWSFLHELGTRN